MNCNLYRKLGITLLVALFLLSTGAVSTALAKRDNLPAHNPSLYAATPQPLTVDQCAQCHPKHFGNLKEAGGKHQFDCRECHEVFHAYNPLKKNYADIMPKCATCHGQPHGPKHTECLNCHTNPHTPRKVAMSKMLSGLCGTCHSDKAETLAANPSKHTEQPCNSCHHSRHGYIPSCEECHEPHMETQGFNTCTSCHDVHQPLNIALAPTVDVKTCDACHGDIYEKWKGTDSKHGKVSCASCHTRHGLIPNCRNCHTTPPHPESMLKKFGECLNCHIDVHDLPVKGGSSM